MKYKTDSEIEKKMKPRIKKDANAKMRAINKTEGTAERDRAKSGKDSSSRPYDIFHVLGMERKYFAIAFILLAVMFAAIAFNCGDSESPKGMVTEFVAKNATMDYTDDTTTISPMQIEEFNEQIAICNQYIAVKDLNNSLECLIEAHTIDPNHEGVIVAIADLYRMDGTYDKAEEYYHKALEIDSMNSMARNNLAIVLKEQNKLNESMEEFRKAVEIEPNNTIILLNYANILAEMGANDEAELNFRRVIELDPSNKEAYKNFAQFYYNNGKYIEAKEMLERSY